MPEEERGDFMRNEMADTLCKGRATTRLGKEYYDHQKRLQLLKKTLTFTGRMLGAWEPKYRECTSAAAAYRKEHPRLATSKGSRTTRVQHDWHWVDGRSAWVCQLCLRVRAGTAKPAARRCRPIEAQMSSILEKGTAQAHKLDVAEVHGQAHRTAFCIKCGYYSDGRRL